MDIPDTHDQIPFYNLLGAKTVLVFGAHGDDEILGCGGTIWTLGQLGAKIIVVTFTMRETAFVGRISAEEATANAREEMTAADRVLGISERIALSITNRKVTHDGDTLVRCAKLIRKYKPDVVLTHFADDQHTDHRGVSGAVNEGSWKAWENINTDPPNPSDPTKGGWGPTHHAPVLHFEIMLRRISRPHLIVTFGEAALEKKIEAMKTQISQIELLREVTNHIEYRARDLGALTGGYAGEAFQISDFHPTTVRLPDPPILGE